MNESEINETEINDKLKEYARTSKNIQYSTKIFAKTEDTSKKPKIVLRELIKGENEKEKHIWAIILKYTIDDIPQEVIMGTLGNTEERKEKAVDIINFIRNQLEENTNSETGYDGYERLCQYVQTLNIPFEFTGEGIDILANKSKKDTSILRTYYSDNQGKIQCKYDEEAVKIRTKDKQQQLFEEANRKKEIQKWKSRREKILNVLNEEKRQDFLNGERLTLFMQEADRNVEAQKNIALNYLQEDSGEEKLKLFKSYLNEKEKGLVIETKKVLEGLEDKYYDGIRKKGGNVNPEELACLELIKEHEKFFDLVKQGRDWSARLNFSLKIKDFNILRKIFEEIKDKELLEYFNLKEKMINEVKLAEIEVDFNKYDSVKELNKFLINCSERETNRGEEQKFISQMYEHVKRLICESNFDSLELYNKYAEKSNRPVCPLLGKKQISNDLYISNIVKKICGDIKTKGLNNSENKNNQSNHEQPEEK